MKFGERYDLDYNQIKTNFQPPPYKTNCKDNDDNKHDHIRTHSDCVIQCLNQEINQKCSHLLNGSDVNGVDDRTHCWFQFRHLWRLELFEQGQNFSNMMQCNNTHFKEENDIDYIKDHCLIQHARSSYVNCKEKCPNDCQIWFYDYHFKTKNIRRQ